MRYVRVHLGVPVSAGVCPPPGWAWDPHPARLPDPSNSTSTEPGEEPLAVGAPPHGPRAGVCALQPAARGGGWDSPSRGAGGHRPGRALSPPIPMSLKMPHGLLGPPPSHGGPQAQGCRRSGQAAHRAGPGEGQLHPVLTGRQQLWGSLTAPFHSLPRSAPPALDLTTRKQKTAAKDRRAPALRSAECGRGREEGAGRGAAAHDPAKLPRAPFFLPVKSHNDTLQQPHSRGSGFHSM